eukprot:365907-Chlamydomonas_euryale.AAC.27
MMHPLWPRSYCDAPPLASLLLCCNHFGLAPAMLHPLDLAPAMMHPLWPRSCYDAPPLASLLL